MPCITVKNAAEISEKINMCRSGKISVRKCAALLHCSPTTVCRWKRRLASGNTSHGLRGKPSNNLGRHGKLYHTILQKYRELKVPLNFSHFASHLKNFHGISKSRNRIRYILKKNGITSPASHAPAKKHLPRAERAQEGELFQLDASTHDWFGNGEKWTIHGAIDDATHKIAALYMTRNECRLGYYEMFLRMSERFGLPREMYMDMSSSFFNREKRTRQEQLAGLEENKTIWMQNCEELSIRLIKAYSPQAKGRIEKLWQTLQDRLVKEFILFGIDTPEKANAFFDGYIRRHNEEFAIPPRDKIPAWRCCLLAKDDLEDMFSVRHYTRTNCKGCFSYHDIDFVLQGGDTRNKKVVLYLSERNGVFAECGGMYRDVKLQLRRKLQTLAHDAMPQVERDLIARYMI